VCDVTDALRQLVVQVQREEAEPASHRRGKVIVIAGPTACGKTDFSLLLAKHVGGEIVSGDAMQVYRGLDIGTAKVSQQQRLDVPHHLIDIRDLSQPFTVVDFYQTAIKTIQEILDRKAVPIIVGGSGFYLHTLVYGPPAGPPPNPQMRTLLEAEIGRSGPEVLYQRLVQLDPEYAEGITCNDRHKIVRGLEIIALTGSKVSALPWGKRALPKKFDWHCWFLYRPKPVLYERIERRCHQMIQQGLLDEVQRMIDQGLRENSPCSNAIGYRQALAYLDSSRSESDYETFMRMFIQSSRHYAKRQFTWFRREPLYRWVDVDALDFENVRELVLKDYEAQI
jgi:tRNA dimethylallyltransferase